MIPAFSSWQDFWAMGGYAFYVWFSVIITFISLAGVVLHTCWQHRQIINNIARQQAREQRLQHMRVPQPQAKEQE